MHFSSMELLFFFFLNIISASLHTFFNLLLV